MEFIVGSLLGSALTMMVYEFKKACDDKEEYDRLLEQQTREKELLADKDDPWNNVPKPTYTRNLF